MSSAANNNGKKETKEVRNAEGETRTVHRLKANQCAIQSVTVYNNQAEITREVVVELKDGGVHEVVAYDLSPEIDPDSIRVAGGAGNATIIEVSHQEVFGDREDMDQTAVILKKIESLRVERVKLQSKLASLAKERQWLDGMAATIRGGVSTIGMDKNPLSGNAKGDNTMKIVKRPYKNNNDDFTGGKDKVALSGDAQGDSKALDNNPLYGDASVQDFLSNTTAFLTYYSEQTARLDEQEFSINENIKEITKQEALSKKKIVQLQQEHLLAFRREVAVVISAPGPTKVCMQVSYIIKNAHWAPSYDVRMTAESEELQLTYFGSITNASGEDWNNVKLYLSTASPSIGGAPPALRFLRIDIDYSNGANYNQRNAFSAPQKKQVTTKTQQALANYATALDDSNWQLEDMLMNTEQLQLEAGKIEKETRLVNTRANMWQKSNKTDGGMTVMTAYAETSHVGASSATFEIPRGSTVISDNKPHKVTITVVRLRAKLSHYATPDSSGHVYLKASAVNTSEQYPFLAGPMDVFMNSNFIAKSELPDVSPQEKFSVFLGVDPGVRLEVKPVRRVKEKQTGIISKSNIESFRHASVVRNTRKNKINITVICQVPAASDERIKVKLLRPDLKQQEHVVKFVDSKLLKWKLAIPPNGHEELNYHYNVEWPAGLSVVHKATQ